MSTTCSSDFPFLFYDVNGVVVPGSKNSDGICTFTNANCGPDTLVHECCKKNVDAEGYNFNEGSRYTLICFVFMFIPLFYHKFGMQTADQRIAFKKRMTPSWVEKIPIGLVQKIFQFGLFAYITAQVMVPIYMRDSIQANLNVSSRNSLLAAEAFLVPFKDIFQFIEDVILIRVNFSLATGNKKQTNHLVHVGILSSVIVGIVASSLGTILAVIPAVLNALTNPGGSNDAILYPECSLIEHDDSNVQTYWIVEMWGIPGQLLGLVMSGFMMGGMELSTVGWLGSIGIGMIPLIWFTSISKHAESGALTLLALAEFAASWVFPIISLVYIMSPLGKDLREHTGFQLELKSFKNVFSGPSCDGPVTRPEETPLVSSVADAADTESQIVGTDNDEEEIPVLLEAKIPSNKEIFLDGLKIMALDVATQICITTGVYLALTKDAAVGYQLTALQSALPAYGIAYATGLGIMFKLAGPHMLADQRYNSFANYSRLVLLCTFLLFPVIVGTVEPFHEGLAFDYGENACEFAGVDKCVDFFSKVFGENATFGKFTLPFTFSVFSFGSCVDSLFLVTRSILLTCMDTNFMLKSAIVALLVYVPAIICVSIGGAEFVGQAASFFITMYLPQAILCIMFLVRIEILIRRMKTGQAGAWERESIVGHFSTSAGISKSFKSNTNSGV